jgi:hypothetical protein
MALGLVVVNLGTLYRLRYVFLILIIILAAEGAAHIVDLLKRNASGTFAFPGPALKHDQVTQE